MGTIEYVLRQNYIVYIRKRKGKETITGTYLKNFTDGIHPYEIPTKELESIKHLPEIMELLDSGALLQIDMPDYLIRAIIGNEKTEGPYCETEYLEVIDEKKGYSFPGTLVDLDISLASNLNKRRKGEVKEYKKLYKGVDKYE